MPETYAEQFARALMCQTKDEAAAWLEAEIDQHMARWTQKYRGVNGREDARDVILSNLGYMAGYYERAASQKVYDLFGAEHPVFGKPDYWTRLSPEQIFEMGRKAGEASERST